MSTTPHSTASHPPLARSLPRYLVRLAHEPSVGLHFMASHMQSRAAPGLAIIARNCEQYQYVHQEHILDAQDAREMLKVHANSACEALKRMESKLNDASADIAEALKRKKQAK